MPYVSLPHGDLTKDSSLIISQVFDNEKQEISLTEIKSLDYPLLSGDDRWPLRMITINKTDGTFIHVTPIGEFAGEMSNTRAYCDLINTLLEK